MTQRDPACYGADGYEVSVIGTKLAETTRPDPIERLERLKRLLDGGVIDSEHSAEC